jgi:hypothetical protein
MRRAKILLAGGLVVLLAAAGCGSGASDSPAAPTTPVGVSKLDVADYNTSLVPLGKQDLKRAKVSEGQRLASVLPLMMDIDPRFKYQDGTDPSAVYGFTGDAAGTDLYTDNLDADAPGFIAGFTVSGATDPDIGIATGVYYTTLIFTDSAAASAGAKILGANQFNHLKTNQPGSIDGHPDTQAIWKPTENTLESFTANDRYVIYTTATDYAMKAIDSPDPKELATLTGKIIEAVPPALKNFKPAPIGQLTDMEFDHDGMLSRSIPKTSGDLGRSPAGIYDRRGALILSNDAATDRDLYAKTGMDWMTTNAGRLYRTRDPHAAEELFQARSILPSRLYRLADSPKNLPEALCDEYRGRNSIHARFHCVVTYGRYAAEMWSDQLLDAQQRISAQYVLMTR